MRPNSGYTKTELLVSIAIITILVALLFPIITAFLAWLRLNIAAFQLSQNWKFSRFDATGNGSVPTTLCMREAADRIEVAQITGDRCENVRTWQSLIWAVKIDTHNSTLRTVSGVAGNNGAIYRVSWADTRGGMGGSWGQLGRLVLTAEGTSARKCLFLFRTDGSWNIRDNRRCYR
ncbi:MAG: hypothetical protein N5P05_004093 (plasmid) [Chroococcopsis gigantea SAG 12.99]|jgi:Tfp pilus assembly protein PilE|nr:hypothetical protein [Chroococcopsis gigantea SAG 12.99]